MATATSRATGLLITTVFGFSLILGCKSADLADDQAIGRPCELPVQAGGYESVYSASAKECPGFCLKPATPEFFGPTPATGPTCSGECTQDSDCEGELRDPNDPSDTRCAGGFTCAVPFAVGPLCCKKLCVCRDFLPPTQSPTPLGCAANATGGSCPGHGSAPISSSFVGVGETTDIYQHAARAGKVDIVTVVANSSSMGPKIDKLKAAFPKLIDALRDPNNGALPDLHIAFIDSDLGTGGAYTSGACGPKTLDDGTSSVYGDMGRFQMLSSPTTCNFTPGARFLEYKSGYTSDISSVLSCLAGNLGTSGCGEVHPLQALEFGLVAQGLGNETQRTTFLRPDASLVLLLLADQDDCSAAPNDGLFGDKPELRGESSSLRCATRAHACGGTNLTTSLPGYPTRASYTHAFSDCQARTDACPSSLSMSGTTDTSVPTQCSPLRDVKEMANAIRSLKSDPDKILVAGIFGWPMADADMASAEYKIAPIPNPNTADTAHPTVFEYWPVCYDPNHLPSAATTDPATGFDATAAAWGATGGLRESAFIDQFGSKGLRFSICQPDFSEAMERIGRAIPYRQPAFCTLGKPVDTDLATPGVQANCRVVYRTPTRDGDTVVAWVEPEDSIPQCAPGATSDTVATDCWQITKDLNSCAFREAQRLTIVRPAAEIATTPQRPDGTKLRLQCQVCPTLSSGSFAGPGCDY